MSAIEFWHVSPSVILCLEFIKITPVAGTCSMGLFIQRV